MSIRRVLVGLSVLGVATTLIAGVTGYWALALALYVLTACGLGALLRRSVRRQATRIDAPVRTANDNTGPPPRISGQNS
jgi:hypothetical protein